MNKKTSKVTDQLNDVLGIAKELIEESELPKQEIIPVNIEDKQKILLKEPIYENDIDNDYRTVRDTLIQLIATAERTLDGLLVIAKESESARVYEVVTTLIKTISEVSSQLIILQKTMKEMKKLDREGGEGDGGEVSKPLQIGKADTVNNIMFNGTTKELQEMMKQSLKQLKQENG